MMPSNRLNNIVKTVFEPGVAMSRKAFGIYAKNLRSKAGLSQLDVSRALGFKSGQVVSNWERGFCYPPIESLKTLAGLYNVSLRTLFNKYCAHLKMDHWKKVNDE